MTRAIGIDVEGPVARVAVVRMLYRKTEVESFIEEVEGPEDVPGAALARAVARAKTAHVDAVATTLPGTRTFVHALSLPLSSEKRLAELLPFELEAELPIEIDELVFDHRMQKRDGAISVLAVAARTEHVKALLASVKESAGVEAERVGDSALELAQLCRLSPLLLAPGPLLLLDVGAARSDACIVSSGEAAHARSFPLGTSAFPGDAEELSRRIKQTLAAHATRTGKSVERAYLSGEGASLAGLAEYLSGQLGLEIAELPELGLEFPLPAPASAEVVSEGLPTRAQAPRFARAIGSALSAARGGGFDLRQGPLAFERGYAHLKERAPLLAGLGFAIVVSFLFATWAEGRALDRKHEALAASLEQITKDTFGTPTSDPDEASELLAKVQKSKPEDPMPYLDGFGAAVVIAETLPAGIKHDIEQFEYTKGKLKLRGLVDSTDEAQRVAKALGEHRCFGEPVITKISQVVNSERERYNLEVDVICPEEMDPSKKPKDKAKAGTAASAEPSGEDEP